MRLSDDGGHQRFRIECLAAFRDHASSDGKYRGEETEIKEYGTVLCDLEAQEDGIDDREKKQDGSESAGDERNESVRALVSDSTTKDK